MAREVTVLCVLALALVLVACAPQSSEGNVLSLKVKAPTTCTGTFSYSVELKGPNQEGLGGQFVSVTLDGQPFERLKTDQNGRFSSSGDMKQEWCNKEVLIAASFEGTTLLGAAAAQQTMKVASCEDGTAVETCSQKTSYYCNAELKLIFDCEKCGCASGLVCSGEKCITSDSKTSSIIADLQKHIVKVNHTFAEGSGIVLAQEEVNGKTHTWVLTNQHVVEASGTLLGVGVFDRYSTTGKTKSIRVAPRGIDLAVIEVEADLGTPVEVKYVSTEKGQAVVALGSPLGFQGSVSKGIISNYVPDDFNSNYTLKHIQTDAAVNPGNSGGGLFRESDGVLIGINTYKYYGTEGLNFAIDFREMNNLPPYKEWLTWAPARTCKDGTPYDYCSMNAPFACIDGDLVPACEVCGCPDDSTQACYTDGKCRIP